MVKVKNGEELIDRYETFQTSRRFWCVICDTLVCKTGDRAPLVGYGPVWSAASW